MQLTSPVFANNEKIPAKYSCEGEDINPPLKIDNIPEGTRTMALIMDDPDAPAGTWDHWIVFNIPVTTSIPEDVKTLGVSGMNSWGRTGYGGPCPPSGTHRYFFRLYALDQELPLQQGASKEELVQAMEGRIIDQAELMGTYTR
ncbi:MAG: YbhB/YbcL family Raf kinase inhibitor-like protein [DPANN group archaeon]|nr:YbhB/YbcL family Raf kinase inhibitor-like protein [DPANN group archaeon]